MCRPFLSFNQGHSIPCFTLHTCSAFTLLLQMRKTCFTRDLLLPVEKTVGSSTQFGVLNRADVAFLFTKDSISSPVGSSSFETQSLVTHFFNGPALLGRPSSSKLFVYMGLPPCSLFNGPFILTSIYFSIGSFLRPNLFSKYKSTKPPSCSAWAVFDKLLWPFWTVAPQLIPFP